MARVYALKPARAIPADPAEIGYLAGLFDGEGSLVRLKGKRSWSLFITNTDLGMMAWLDQMAIGRVSQIARSVSFLNGRPIRPLRPCYRWHVGGDLTILALLEAMLPLLTVKRRRAEAAIADIRDHEANPVQRAGRGY